MARPQKSGLDYFPLDVDIDQDDKIALIEAQHGVVGFAVVIKLLMKIYKNSYFYEWTEKEQLLFSKRINVDINLINVIINDCIKWGLFDSNLLKTKKILTSKGVQARYLEAVGRRTKVEIKKEYLLLDENIINVHKNLVIVDINSSSEEVSDDINPQSKVKESKENKSKGKEMKEEKEETPSLPPLSFPTQTHEKFYEQWGENSYRTWFMDAIVVEGEIIKISVSQNFKKEILISNYKEYLEILTGRKIEITDYSEGD